MEYVNFYTLERPKKEKVTRIIGFRGKKPISYAKLEADNQWHIFNIFEKSPCNSNNRLIKTEILNDLNALILYFQHNNLIPFCPQPETIVTGFKDKESKQVTHNDSLQKRNYYRKEVQLPGTFINKRTEETGDLVIYDLSFQGLGFSPIGFPDIRIGDLLNVFFTLDNLKQSKIQRIIEIKHMNTRFFGGQFINSPSMDSKLGFYLMK
jgi:hypothetical protein